MPASIGGRMVAGRSVSPSVCSRLIPFPRHPLFPLQMRRAPPSAPENIFCEIVEQANALGCHKTARFEWFVCAGAARQVLHFWVDKVGVSSSDNG